MATLKEEKRELILNAAIEVFAQYGFHSAKMAKIAEIAGVGAGSLYLYFKNKNHIIQEILNDFWKEQTEMLENCIADNAIEAVRKLDDVIDIIIDKGSQKEHLAKIIIQETGFLTTEKSFFDDNVHFKRFSALITSFMEKGKEKGIFKKSVDVPIVISFMTGGLRELLGKWADDPELFSLESIKRTIKIFSRSGVLDSDYQDEI